MQECRNAFHLTEIENKTKEKRTRVKQYKRKLRVLHKKVNFTKYEENNHPKEKRKKSIKQSEKGCFPKKYNALMSHLNIRIRKRVGLWMCALKKCAGKKSGSEKIKVRYKDSMQMKHAALIWTVI